MSRKIALDRHGQTHGVTLKLLQKQGTANRSAALGDQKASKGGVRLVPKAVEPASASTRWRDDPDDRSDEERLIARLSHDPTWWE